MVMSNEEIKREYNEAKDKKKQIGILAELNCCSKKEIQNILENKNPLEVSIFEEIDKVETEMKNLHEELKKKEEWYNKLLVSVEVISNLQTGKKTA